MVHQLGFKVLENPHVGISERPSISVNRTTIQFWTQLPPKYHAKNLDLVCQNLHIERNKRRSSDKVISQVPPAGENTGDAFE